MTIVVICDYAIILRMHWEGLILFVVVAADGGYGNEGGEVPYFVIFSYILLDLLTYILSTSHTSRYEDSSRYNCSLNKPHSASLL